MFGVPGSRQWPNTVAPSIDPRPVPGAFSSRPNVGARPYACRVTDELEDPEQPEDDEAGPTDSAQGHVNQIIKNLQANIATAAPILRVSDQVAELTQGIVARQQAERDRVEDFSAQQREYWDEIADAKQRWRDLELEWRNNLLAQQRLTVDALQEMSKAQVSDRRVNVWVLGIAAAALIVTALGVFIQLVK